MSTALKSAALLLLLVTEPHHTQRIAEEIDGTPEYRLPNGSRVDILTDDVAWEVERSESWEESIGQSLFYAISTDRKPGVYLLLIGDSDEDYLQCLTVVNHLRQNGVEIEFRTEKVD